MVESMVRDWVDRYVQAWSSNDAKEIGELFAEDGRYRTAPFREAWEGRQAIVDEWLGRKDDPGTWAFTYDVLAVADDVAFVQGETAYTDGDTFSNLWVVRLDPDGRSREFTEWWMEQK